MTALDSASCKFRIASAEALILALYNCPPEYAGPIVDEWIAAGVTSGPIASFDDIQSDAKFWADIATETELRVYLGAILRHLRNKSFGQASRKDLFIKLWGGFSEADRLAFLGRVDPNGQFHHYRQSA